jgi:hypothetical protein
MFPKLKIQLKEQRFKDSTETQAESQQCNVGQHHQTGVPEILPVAGEEAMGLIHNLYKEQQ